MQDEKLNCRRWRATANNTASSVAIALLLAAGAAHAGMYRWVDSNGRVQYSDTPPVTFNQSGGAEMNKQGQVVKRTQSEAERRAEAERLAEQKKVEQAQQKQAQLDRALLATYTSEAEIDLARDRALENHKLVVTGAETRAKAVDANVAELRGRIAGLQRAGKTVNPNLNAQLAQAVRESEELKRTIQSTQAAMVQVREKYAADKLRFREISAKD